MIIKIFKEIKLNCNKIIFSMTTMLVSFSAVPLVSGVYHISIFIENMEKIQTSEWIYLGLGEDSLGKGKIYLNKNSVRIDKNYDGIVCFVINRKEGDDKFALITQYVFRSELMGYSFGVISHQTLLDNVVMGKVKVVPSRDIRRVPMLFPSTEGMVFRKCEALLGLTNQ